MKSFIILSLLFFGCASAFKLPDENSRIRIVLVPGQSQFAIYEKSREWFSWHFKSGKSVIDYASPETGKLVGKGYLGANELLGRKNLAYNYYMIIIDAKPGGAKIEVKPLGHCWEGGSMGYYYKPAGEASWPEEGTPMLQGTNEMIQYDVDKIRNSFIEFLAKSSAAKTW